MYDETLQSVSLGELLRWADTFKIIFKEIYRNSYDSGDREVAYFVFEIQKFNFHNWRLYLDFVLFCSLFSSSHTLVCETY